MSYIKGNFRKYIFKTEKGYVVGLFKIRETSEDLEDYKNNTVTFTGYFPELNETDLYLFNGGFVEHNRYGEQFGVVSYEVIFPSDKDNIVSFLASDLFKGIGDKKALKIVEVLGENALDVIIANPDSLFLVPTVTLKQKDIIYKSLLEYKNSYNSIVELTKIGFNIKDALAIYSFYKEDVLNIINNNIYKIIDDIHEINFKKIEQIRSYLNIEENDIRRVAAGIKYVMEEVSFSLGNTYFSKEEIFLYLKKAIFISDTALINDALKNLEENEDIIIKEEKYFLKDMYNAEIYCAERIFNLANTSKEIKIKNTEISELEEYFNINFNNDQKTAIEASIKNNLLVITGGPGTGKTTIIKAIARLYQKINSYSDQDLMKNLALLAPTGRAAKRISEQTLLPAYTIHRYLKWNKEENTFLVNEEEPSDVRMVIVDEASMIDIFLLESLLKGLKLNTKIIIVGDYNQLPSVGAGQILKDIIESDCVNVIKLNELYRQEMDSNIISLAYDINNHQYSMELFNNEEDLSFVDSNSGNLKNLLKPYIELYKDFEPSKFQILAPMYKGENGIDDLNNFIQTIVNPRTHTKNEMMINGVIFREGDKVLQLINMVDQNVFNGDIGKVIKVSKDNKEILVDFDSDIVRYTPTNYNNIKLAYSISIHKSQGSEFDIVIIPVLNNYYNMLYNKLIYTAVTRAKKKLILIGEQQALNKAIFNDKENERTTNLKSFIISFIKN